MVERITDVTDANIRIRFQKGYQPLVWRFYLNIGHYKRECPILHAVSVIRVEPPLISRWRATLVPPLSYSYSCFMRCYVWNCDKANEYWSKCLDKCFFFSFFFHSFSCTYNRFIRSVHIISSFVHESSSCKYSIQCDTLLKPLLKHLVYLLGLFFTYLF